MSKARSRFRPWPLLFAGFIALIAPFVGHLVAQGVAPAPVAPETINVPTDPSLQGFKWRSICPAGQGGRWQRPSASSSDEPDFSQRAGDASRGSEVQP